MSNDLNVLSLMNGLGEGRSYERNIQDQRAMEQARLQFQQNMLGERLDSQASLKQAAIAAQGQRLTESLGVKGDIADKNINSRAALQGGKFDFQDYLKRYQSAVSMLGRAPGLEQTVSSQPLGVQQGFKNSMDSIMAGLGPRNTVQPTDPPVQGNPAPPITSPIDTGAPVDMSNPSAPSTQAMVNPNITPVPAPTDAPLAPTGAASIAADPAAGAASNQPLSTPVPAQPDPSSALAPTPVQSSLLPTSPDSLPAINPTSLMGLAAPTPVPQHDPDTEPQGTLPSSTPSTQPSTLFNPDPFKVAKVRQGDERLSQGGQRLTQTDKENALRANEFEEGQKTTRRGQDLGVVTGQANRDSSTQRIQMQIDAALERQKLGISNQDFLAKYNQGQQNYRANNKDGGAGGVVDPMKYYKGLHSIQADQSSALTGMGALTKPGKAPFALTNKLDGTPLKDPVTGLPQMSTPLQPRIIMGADGTPDATKSDPNSIPLYNQLKNRYLTAKNAETAYTKPVPSATAEGDAIGDITSRLPGESQGAYIHRCQQRARVAYQEVTSAYNPYFGGSAKETLNNFKQGGLAKPYNPGQPLPPGSMLFSSKMGGDNGHVQVVGVGGTRFDQYGQNKFGLGNFDYFVPPPGLAKMPATPQPVKPPASAVPQNFYSPSYSLTGIPPNKTATDIFKQ